MDDQKRRLLLFGGAVCFLLVVFCIGAFSGSMAKPYVVSRLLEQGVEQASIESMALNPFTLSVRIRGVEIRKTRSSIVTIDDMAVDFSLWSLLRKKVRIESANIRGLKMAVQGQAGAYTCGGFPLRWRPGSIDSADRHPGKQPWMVELTQAAIAESRLHFQVAGLDQNLRIQKLMLWNGSASDTGIDGFFTLTGTFGPAELKMDSAADLKGASGSASIKIALKNLDLSQLRRWLPESVSGLSGTVSANTRLTVDREKGRIEITEKGNWRVDNFQASAAPYAVANDQAAIQTDFLLTLRDQAVSSTRLVAALDGRDFQMRETDTGFTIAACKTGKVEEIELLYQDSLSIRIVDIRTDGVELAVPPGDHRRDFPLLAAGRMSVDSMQLADHTLTVGRVFCKDMQGAFLLDPDRTPVNIPDLQFFDLFRPVTAGTAGGASDSAKSPVDIRVGRVEIAGKSRFAFIDEGVDPVFTEVMQIRHARIQDLNSTRPLQESLFSVSCALRETGRLDLEGRCRLFDEKPSLVLKTRLTGYPLPALSAYAGEKAGCTIKSGQLASVADLNLHGRTLSGTIRLHAGGIEVQPSASVAVDQYQPYAGIPAAVGIGYLADPNGDLRLAVPVSGRLGDCGFGWANLLADSAVRSFRSAAYARIRKTIQPYNALIHHHRDPAVYHGDFPAGIRLDPVVLEPGAVLPGENADEFTRQLAEWIRQQSALPVFICGFATDADRDILAEQAVDGDMLEQRMQDIAGERADIFREILVAHYGVDGSRILVCAPRIDRQNGAQPRIEIRL